LVGNIIEGIAGFDKTISQLTPKDCVFRIYRDVRFSNDKRPYKENFGALIAPGGRKNPSAGYYLHIEPQNSFLGGGVYCPMPEDLKKIREAIYADSQEFTNIIEKNNFKSYFKEIWGEKSSRPPKGFDKNFPDIELLKYKSYVSMHEIADEVLLSSDFVEYCLKIYEASFDLNNFLNNAIK